LIRSLVGSVITELRTDSYMLAGISAKSGEFANLLAKSLELTADGGRPHAALRKLQSEGS
jgi:hypothetical protein